MEYFIPKLNVLNILSFNYNNMSNRNKTLFFKTELEKVGIEPIYMVGLTEDFSFYKGGVRLKLIRKNNR